MWYSTGDAGAGVGRIRCGLGYRMTHQYIPHGFVNVTFGQGKTGRKGSGGGGRRHIVACHCSRMMGGGDIDDFKLGHGVIQLG